MVPIAPSRITIFLASRSTISNASEWRRLSGIMLRKISNIRRTAAQPDRLTHHDNLMGYSSRLHPQRLFMSCQCARSDSNRNRPRRRPVEDDDETSELVRQIFLLELLTRGGK